MSSELGSPSLSDTGRWVRKESFSNRVRSAPYDWFMRIQEDWETLDWDSLQETLSWPMIILTNGAFLFLRLSHSLESPEIIRYEYGRAVPSGWLDASTIFWINMFEIVLFALSIINTVYLFTRTRQYRLFDSSSEMTSHNSHVRRANENDKPPGLLKRFLRFLVRPLWRMIGYVPQYERKVHILYMWDPPLFSLNLFCWWSPPQLAVYFGLNADNWPFFLPVAIAVAIQTYYLCKTYVHHVKDKQLLYGQVYSEYNTKFVNKSISLLARDQSTLSQLGDFQSFSMSPPRVYDSPMTKSLSFTATSTSARQRRQPASTRRGTTTAAATTTANNVANATTNGFGRQRALSEHPMTPTPAATSRRNQRNLGLYDPDDQAISEEDYSENQSTRKEEQEEQQEQEEVARTTTTTRRPPRQTRKTRAL